MYNIIKIQRGREEIVFTNTLPKCNNRLVQLRNSKIKGCKFELRIASELDEKYSKPPHDGSYRSGDVQHPRSV